MEPDKVKTFTINSQNNRKQDTSLSQMFALQGHPSSSKKERKTYCKLPSLPPGF